MCMEKIRAEGVDVPKDRILVIGDSMTSDMQLAKMQAWTAACMIRRKRNEKQVQVPM